MDDDNDGDKDFYQDQLNQYRNKHLKVKTEDELSQDLKRIQIEENKRDKEQEQEKKLQVEKVELVSQTTQLDEYKGVRKQETDKTLQDREEMRKRVQEKIELEKQRAAQLLVDSKVGQVDQMKEYQLTRSRDSKQQRQNDLAILQKKRADKELEEQRIREAKQREKQQHQDQLNAYQQKQHAEIDRQKQQQENSHIQLVDYGNHYYNASGRPNNRPPSLLELNPHQRIVVNKPPPRVQGSIKKLGGYGSN
ncbi:hypothetical protein DFA_12082 [Cavenderia fasciculata]|uniref:Uncharacterized protein n=1 Tax=Cavenderia fasciculata TaxID=261658 RepID=F4QFR5_CACFS|nr:uncharacterized protein DFA_12082 [Cavenderia fasciculata]EGG14312.1 hypothetical protein DFA_12082 [Cavenderia fasciculata]|eukprot:XP_004351021.1 hypothetical protein DFA_12082 [Cavenderia fasciculata]